jgi:hypothetical protein
MRSAGTKVSQRQLLKMVLSAEKNFSFAVAMPRNALKAPRITKGY